MKLTPQQIKDLSEKKILDDKIYPAVKHFLQNANREYRIIKYSSWTSTAVMFDKSDLSAVTYNSIRGDESGTWWLYSKICGGVDWHEGKFAGYWTKDFALAALEKIYADFDAGKEYIECPREGLYEPYKAWYNGKVVNSWEVPRYNPCSNEINLFAGIDDEK